MDWFPVGDALVTFVRAGSKQRNGLSIKAKKKPAMFDIRML